MTTALSTENGNAGIGGIKAASFGSTTTEFVFYPIVPCRLLDTREGGTNLTPFVPYGVDFDGGNPGNTGGCTCSGIAAQLDNSLSGISRAALVINLTVAEPEAIGWIRARPVGSSNICSNQNFNPGDNIANKVIVQDANAADEFELLANQATHAVVEVLGVFLPPLATAIECTYETLDGTDTGNVANNSQFTFTDPAVCPATYTLTSIRCEYGKRRRNSPAVRVLGLC